MEKALQQLEVEVSEEVELLEHLPVDSEWLADLGKRALPLCLATPGKSENVLAELGGIEVSVLSDSEIAAVHGQFLEDPTPTDVITFHHGEILISVETAARQGPEHGLDYQQELALYLIHGLLHLAGWDDHEPSEAAQMAFEQERILLKVL